MIRKSILTALVAVFLAGLVAPAQATTQTSEPTESQVQANASMYMVYYKKPSWTKWKCCGPYSYNKACKVADSLEDQGCKTCIKEAN